MDSSKNAKQLRIDQEALSSLALVQAGLLHPVTRLMNRKEAEETDKSKRYKGVPFPFSFILAPAGKKNAQTLADLQSGEKVDLLCDNKKVGSLRVEETFEIDPVARLQTIFGTADPSHPGVAKTMQRLGTIAVSGDFEVEYPLIEDTKRRLEAMIEKTGAKRLSAMMIAANPLNRAHERIIRQAIEECDLLVLFLHKPFGTSGLTYDLRFETLHYFIDNFLPPNRVLILPFENTYLFAGYSELVLDAILAKNYGCSRLIVGRNHAGLGLYYDQNRSETLFDRWDDLGIEIKTVDELVYCDTCKTLVTTLTCPHGQHHHIHYHSESILELIEAGIIPPSILVRKEIGAKLLAALFPDRLHNMAQIRYSLMPGSGLLEQENDEEFYLKLIALYQTTSLT